ncbi:hypothetical protein PAPHI01_1174 [Pancytospora philotis]|nr:hypothetical protein PAPHI01_1174 [Pancytospora philotis]
MIEESRDTNMSIAQSPVLEKATLEHDSASQPKLRRFVKRGSVILGCIVVGFVCSLLLRGYENEQHFFATLLSFIEYMAFFVAAFTALSTALLFSEYLLRQLGIEANFIYGIFNRYSDLIALMLVSFVFSYYLRINTLPVDPATTAAAAGAAPNAAPAAETLSSKLLNAIGWQKVFENIAAFYMAISLCAGVFFIKSILLYGLSYHVHFVYYAERIAKNAAMVDALKTLNQLIDAGSSDDYDIISAQLVEKLSHGIGVVSFAELCKAISREEATAIYAYLDRDCETDHLENHDFRILYENTMNEQAQLANGLTHKNSSVENLNFVANFLCIAICASIVYSQLLSSGSGENRIALVITGLASGGYIFSDIIKNFLGSLIFVFFTRPCEINDYVIVDGHLSKVMAINMLTSSLAVNKLIVIHPNNKLLGTPITNLRLSKTYEQVYTYPFNLHNYRSKKDDLLQALKDHIDSHPKIFRRNPYYKDSKLVSQKVLSVSIVVGFNIDGISLSRLHENTEKFLLDLQTIFDKVGLLPYE